ncbi:hypothetical protein [Umezakia ovalisporum]|uniref:Uncharacterized protein n=1 Tax=Umezakia ovalisporum FSS-43 TaxID=2740520 RepID=A0ABT6K464_9CYAN|nr:hypothetical protein [Umezakia ovalisporum]MDH6057151.1 hypothetical protein [Umezakia ovalisporum FSS-43]
MTTATTAQASSPFPTTRPIIAGSSLEAPSVTANSRLAIERSTTWGMGLRVTFIYCPINPRDTQPPSAVLSGRIPVLNS